MRNVAVYVNIVLMLPFAYTAYSNDILHWNWQNMTS